jgi:hypothetical protein
MAPILMGPNWSLPFHMSTDALDKTIKVVLREKEENKPYAIYLINTNLTLLELNYIVIEKEFTTTIYFINKL